MSPFYLKLLLLIFVIHLVVFTRIALRTRRGYHQSLVATFICLVAMVALRMWGPGLSLGSLTLWYLFRWGAWAFTLLAAVLWVGHRRHMARG